MIIDSHCHLDYLEKSDTLEGAMVRAEQAGLSILLTISTKLTAFPTVLSIADRYPNVYCTVGVHPHEADSEGQDSPKALLKWAEHPKVVGIGETGLDYHYDHSARERQRTSFRAHIDAARRSGLPLIIHTRNADADMAEILREEQGRGPFPAVLHCFSSSPELAWTAIDLGMYISFSGILTFKSAKDLQNLARDLPFDRILIETDAPYLAPVPLRGKSNEPSYIVHTLQKLADLREESSEKLAQQTSENFFQLFQKIPKGAVS